MELDTVAGAAQRETADKQDMDQIIAGWAGIVVCGLVTAVIWANAIRAVAAPEPVAAPLASIEEFAATVCTPINPNPCGDES